MSKRIRKAIADYGFGVFWLVICVAVVVTCIYFAIRFNSGAWLMAATPWCIGVIQSVNEIAWVRDVRGYIAWKYPPGEKSYPPGLPGLPGRPDVPMTLAETPKPGSQHDTPS